MKKETKKTLWIVTIFAIAMGFLEGAVVVYLRSLVHPQGFSFPLNSFYDPFITGIEWIREITTIVMLVTVGMLAAKKFYPRLAFFLYSFAVWDIFYYIFLKLSIDWPASILTWDILFLIPWPWLGPVIAPLLCTVVMIISAFIILQKEDLKGDFKFEPKEWAIIILGLLLIMYTWLYDYGKLIINGGFVKDFFSLAENEQFSQVIGSFIPTTYNWPLFLIGLAITSIGIFLGWRRNRRKA